MTRDTRPQAAVAVYARYSTERQDARSIDDQVRRCCAFAETRGLEVAGVFKDAAESGAHLERADEIAETAPQRARASLSRILVPITLVPVRDPDGTRRYEARGAPSG